MSADQQRQVVQRGQAGLAIGAANCVRTIDEDSPLGLGQDPGCLPQGLSRHSGDFLHFVGRIVLHPLFEFGDPAAFFVQSLGQDDVGQAVQQSHLGAGPIGQPGAAVAGEVVATGVGYDDLGPLQIRRPSDE